MVRLKSLYNIVDTFFFSMWGLTLIDLVAVANHNLFSDIDSKIKTVMAIVGAVYFLIKIYHNYFSWREERKQQKIDTEIKKEELEKITKSNDKDE